MTSRSKAQPKTKRTPAKRAAKRMRQVTLIRAVHEQLTSGQMLHLPIHTQGRVEKDMGTSLRVRFTPTGESLHPANSPLSLRLMGDRVVSVTCVVARAIVREVRS